MNNRGHLALPVIALVLLNSCGLRRAGVFRVLPGSPDYLLQSPDGHESPFPEILRRYNGFEPGRNGMDLHPQMELRIENAYYQEGMPKRGLNGYLGTEIAHYRVRPEGGLKLLSIQSMKERPADQAPVQELISAVQQHYHYYRFYFEILFRKSSTNRGSVLLGANSQEELSRVAALLTTQPDVACESKSAYCTVFPEACSVSVEMEIVVNGKSKSVIWGSSLGRVITNPRQIRLRRLNDGRLVPVQVDPLDTNALKLPLLPGDRIEWK
jgi:hypothetical protein